MLVHDPSCRTFFVPTNMRIVTLAVAIDFGVFFYMLLEELAFQCTPTLGLFSYCFTLFLSETSPGIFLHYYLPSPWSCATLLFASDNCVSKSFLSVSLFISCSLMFCSSETRLLSSTVLWLWPACWGINKTEDMIKDIKKPCRIDTHFTPLHHIYIPGPGNGAGYHTGPFGY